MDKKYSLKVRATQTNELKRVSVRLEASVSNDFDHYCRARKLSKQQVLEDYIVRLVNKEKKSKNN